MGTKAKTKKIVAKRFKVSKNGKIMRHRQNKRHLRASKSRRQLRRLSETVTLTGANAKMVGRFLPYS